MTEIRFQPGGASTTPRVFRVNERSLLARAALGVGGLLLAAGVAGTPYLLLRTVHRLDAHATARRGEEALGSVLLRKERLLARLVADELVLARLAAIASIPLADGFPADAPATPRGARPPPTSPPEAELSALARRLGAAVAMRERIAAGSASLDAAHLPSRSPVEPSIAVPVATFGPRVSQLTKEREHFAGLTLAVPAGTPVAAPAFGTVVFAGPVPARAGAAWRRLGTVVVLSHGPALFTVYGHLGSIAVRRGQRLARGETFARAGRRGVTGAPSLHYEVRRVVNGRAAAVDPRLYILDGDWLSPGEARAAAATAPAGEDLPSSMR